MVEYQPLVNSLGPEYPCPFALGEGSHSNAGRKRFKRCDEVTSSESWRELLHKTRKGAHAEWLVHIDHAGGVVDRRISGCVKRTGRMPNDNWPNNRSGNHGGMYSSDHHLRIRT